MSRLFDFPEAGGFFVDDFQSCMCNAEGKKAMHKHIESDLYKEIICRNNLACVCVCVCEHLQHGKIEMIR